jgi:hypothetical protein
VFTIKSDHGLSEVGYDKIIEWARSILPEGNRLKENFYAAKSMMKPLGLGYQKIDMCSNFCMLYYLENAEMTECMTCWHSRYKLRTGRERTLVAYKKLRYFPITPRLQRLFMSPRTAEHKTWHQAHDAVDGVMVHLSTVKRGNSLTVCILTFKLNQGMCVLGCVQTDSTHLGHLLLLILVGQSYSQFITCHRECV